jgi:hypothetical protein
MSKKIKISLLIVILLILGAIVFNRERVKNVFNSVVPPAAKTGQNAPTVPLVNSKTIVFSWHYKDKLYQLKLAMSPELYQSYQSSSHEFEYSGQLPADWRDTYYGMFLKTQPQDKIMESLVSQLKQQAAANHLSGDEPAQLAIAFVQSIPYDQAKAKDKNAAIDYPYETLYKQTGICSDKVELAVALLRQLGYGAAILSFPDHDHAAVGIECPDNYALPNTAYCYIETTDFFPIGFIPQVFDPSGLAVKTTADQGLSKFDKAFNAAVLGKLEIYQPTTGQVYQDITVTYQRIAALKNYQDSLDAAKQEIAAWQQKIDGQKQQVDALATQLQTYKQQNDYQAYNQLLDSYNSLVRSYNDLVANYKLQVETYNTTVTNYDLALKAIYVAEK